MHYSSAEGTKTEFTLLWAHTNSIYESKRHSGTNMFLKTKNQNEGTSDGIKNTWCKVFIASTGGTKELFYVLERAQMYRSLSRLSTTTSPRKHIYQSRIRVRISSRYFNVVKILNTEEPRQKIPRISKKSWHAKKKKSGKLEK